MGKILNKIRICDGSKIKRGEHWQSCVDICDEEDCPQKLVKKSKKS